MQLYPILDELCDKYESLNPKNMDSLGNKARAFDQDLDEILETLKQMTEVSFDKNKYEFLYQMLEKAIESDEQVDIIIERLKALERIHKESPNIETSIH